MALVAVLVSIGDEIIYYNENEIIGGLITTKKHEKISDYESLSQAEEKYSIHPNALILKDVINGNTEYNESIYNLNSKNETICVSLGSNDELNIYQFHYQIRMNLVIGFIIHIIHIIQCSQLSDDENVNQQKVTILFDSIYQSIQNYFKQSTEIPVYIIRLRCHILTEKLLSNINYSSFCKFLCCFKHSLSTSNISGELIYDSSQKGTCYKYIGILWCGCFEQDIIITTKYIKQIRWDGCSKMITFENIKDIRRQQSCCYLIANALPCFCCINDIADIVIYHGDIDKESLILKRISNSMIVYENITAHLQEIHGDWRKIGRKLCRKIQQIEMKELKVKPKKQIDAAIEYALDTVQKTEEIVMDTDVIKDDLKEEKVPKLIDNIFGDLENMFYLLSDLIFMVMIKSVDGCCDVITNLLRFITWFIVYPLVFILVMIMVLPSCILLLIVRMNKIESVSEDVKVRQGIIENETCWQRTVRLLNQLFRASFMFGILTVYPLIMVYVIIPRYGYSDGVVLTSIGSYLFIILGLQIFGTYRGLKSFYEKHKFTKINGRNSEFKPRKFIWNIGSLWAVLMVIYEVNQMALFAFHTINADDDMETDSEPLIKIENKDLIGFNNKLRDGLASVSFFTLSNLDKIPILEYYLVFGLCCVGILILFFMFRFIYELRMYAIYKRIECNEDKAREYYFHSFVGTIIYGHGRLENVSKLTAKIVSLISDAAFLAICEKLILILVCIPGNNASFLMLDEEESICWEGKHKHYAAICLILIAYYIPLSTMIAPMFDEIPGEDQDKEDENDTKKKCFCCNTKEKIQKKELDVNSRKAKIKKFVSMENCVDFVKPFVSAVTVTKCFMLISATFIFKGNVYGTIISQSISCFILLIFTIKWTFNNLNKYGLTQNEPGFPFGVSLIRSLGFFAAIIGCIVEILKVTNVIDTTLDFVLLIIILFIATIWILYLLWKYHKKFNNFDDDIDVNLLLKYNYTTNKIEIYNSEWINYRKAANC